MPERQKKEGRRSLRELLNAREDEKRELKVTERGQGAAIALGKRQSEKVETKVANPLIKRKGNPSHFSHNDP
jgi:hypothetical protein